MRESQLEDKVFGKVLRELRLASGKSQEGLALDADLERTFISMLELGQRCPSLKTLIALARGLNYPLVDIIDAVDQAYKMETGKSLHEDSQSSSNPIS